MKPDDYVGFFTRMEAYERRKWKDISDYAWETWEAKRVPQRAIVNAFKIYNSVKI